MPTQTTHDFRGDCGRCDGTGTIWRGLPDDWGGIEEWYEARCPECDGKGTPANPHNELQPLIDYMERDRD
jgi:DnaJ-class molecular chaperone